MKTAVIGSRGFADYGQLATELDKYEITTIISGGARGADQLAARYAQERNINLVEHLPEYEKYGRRAPLVRNELIIKEADQVIAFWDGASTGTAHAVSLARKLGKNVHTVRFD